MLKQKLIIAGIATAFALAVAVPVAATTLEKMSMNTMAKSADIVVVGTPTGSVVTRENGQILTKTTFSVSGDVFGDAPSTVTVVTPGGRVNVGKLQGSEIVAGTPIFPGNLDVMLFLEETDSGEYAVAGFNQGYFSVSGGEVLLAPSDGGATQITDAFELIRQARIAGAGQVSQD